MSDLQSGPAGSQPLQAGPPIRRERGVVYEAWPDPYEEGAVAREAGKPRSANPHVDLKAKRAWDAGWSGASLELDVSDEGLEFDLSGRGKGTPPGYANTDDAYQMGWDDAEGSKTKRWSTDFDPPMNDEEYSDYLGGFRDAERDARDAARKKR